MSKENIFAFVVMPFADEYNNVYDLSIKRACEDCNVFCQRVDEQTFSTTILNQIQAQIKKADFIIADMSEKNPNVFYEVGYARGLDKDVVFVINDKNDIQFDVSWYLHIVYDKNNLSDLTQKLIEKIQVFGNNKKNSNIADYKYSINGEEIKEDARLEVEPNTDDENTIIFNIDIFNKSDKKIVPKNAILNLIIPKAWVDLESNMYPITEEGNRIIMEIGPLPDLLPGQSTAEPVYIEKSKKNPDQFYDKPTEIILRIISEHGNFDKKFMLRLKKKQ